MTATMRILEDGGNDLAIVNVAKARANEPPSELLWTCQHSCTPEQIAICTDLNCEASLTFDEADADYLRELALTGDWAPFDQVRVRLHSSVPLAGPGIQVEGDTYIGSALAFARLTQPDSDALRHAFEATFWVAGRLLFSQRVAVLDPASSAALVLAAHRDASGRHFLAWGRFLARSIALEAGLTPVSDTGRAQALRSWIATDLAEYGGPDVRLVVRLDAERAQALRAHADERAAAGTPYAEILAETVEQLGLPVLHPQPEAMLRALLPHLPLP